MTDILIIMDWVIRIAFLFWVANKICSLFEPLKETPLNNSELHNETQSIIGESTFKLGHIGTFNESQYTVDKTNENTPRFVLDNTPMFSINLPQKEEIDALEEAQELQDIFSGEVVEYAEGLTFDNFIFQFQSPQITLRVASAFNIHFEQDHSEIEQVTQEDINNSNHYL